MGALAAASDAGIRAGGCAEAAGGTGQEASVPAVEDSIRPHGSATSRVGCGSLTGGALFRVSPGEPLSWPANFWSPLVYSATIRRPAKRSLELALFRRGLRDRLGDLKDAARNAEIRQEGDLGGEWGKKGRSESRDCRETRCSV